MNSCTDTSNMDLSKFRKEDYLVLTPSSLREEEPEEPLPPCRELCAVPQSLLERRADETVSNRSYFLGITRYGYQNPIREAINPLYQDKIKGSPRIDSFLPKRSYENKTDYGVLAENFRTIDVYSGPVDGNSYGSQQRFHRQKIRHTRSKIGPETKYCFQLTDSMNYGWWQRDKNQLEKTKWYAPRQRFPQVKGEITKFVDEMAIGSPNFSLF